MLELLTDIQDREALTDAEMADRLGVSRSQWNLVKNGHRPLSHAVAMRAAGIWPELTRHLLDMAVVSVSASTNTSMEAA